VQVVERSAPFAPSVIGAIALGGAIGATARWGVRWLDDNLGTPMQPGVWPWATLVVNVVGCLLIGFAARRLTLHTVGWAFVVTGILGGFTTFSALAVELNDLAEADRLALAVLYGTISVAAGVAATFTARRPVEVGE
jgi:fluoride exporter